MRKQRRRSVSRWPRSWSAPLFLLHGYLLNLQPYSVTVRAWSETPKTGFLTARLLYSLFICNNVVNLWVAALLTAWQYTVQNYSLYFVFSIFAVYTSWKGKLTRLMRFLTPAFSVYRPVSSSKNWKKALDTVKRPKFLGMNRHSFYLLIPNFLHGTPRDFSIAKPGNILNLSKVK